MDALRDENTYLKGRVKELERQLEESRAEFWAYHARADKHMSALTSASIECSIELDKLKNQA